MARLAPVLVALFGSAFAADYKEVWRAADYSTNGRRLQTTHTVEIRIAKGDYFGPIHPRFSIAAKIGDDFVDIEVPNTDGNRGDLLPAAWVQLSDRDQVQIEGVVEEPQGNGDGSPGSRGVLMGVEETVGTKPKTLMPSLLSVGGTNTWNDRRIRRRLEGTSPAVISLLVILAEPDDSTLVKATAENVQNVVFGTGDSYANMVTECSHGISSVVGKVLGPLKLSPNSNSVWDIMNAAEAAAEAANPGEWAAHDHQAVILPDSWLSAIGLGTVGGGYTWYKESYYHAPQMYLHEVGHNHRLHHAGVLNGGEYSDSSSAMGACCSSRCFHFIHSWQLGWAEFMAEIQDTDVPASGSKEYTLPATGDSADSGLKIDFTGGGNNEYVLSFRGTTGYDSRISGRFQNSIHLHKWDGTARSSAKITRYISQAATGETITLDDASMAVTYLEASGSNAKILVCHQSAMVGGACAGDVSTPPPTAAPTAAPTSAPTQPPTATPTAAPTTPAPPGDTYAPTAPPTAAPTAVPTDAPTVSPTATTSAPTSASPAPTAPPTPPTASPTWAPTAALQWSAYFSDEQGTSALSNQALVGMGCKGDDCDQVTVATDAIIIVDLAQAVWQDTTADNDLIECPYGQVIARIECHGEECSRLKIECAPVLGGSLMSHNEETDWFPAKIGETESRTCPAGHVVTGVYCGSSKCATKRLVCQEFRLSGECVPQCLAKSCGSDGCGGQCGACGGAIVDPTVASMSCMADIGQCVTTAETDWIDKFSAMGKTSRAASGMKCRGGFCAQVSLVVMNVGVNVESTTWTEWVSDNKGKKYFWNNEAADLSADCPAGTVATRLECDGKFCDNIRLECATPNLWQVDTSGTHPWVAETHFSEEGDGRQDCPVGFALIGIECLEGKGWLDGCFKDCNGYCDKKRLRCRQITPKTMGRTAEDIGELLGNYAKDCDDAVCDGNTTLVSSSPAVNAFGGVSVALAASVAL